MVWTYSLFIIAIFSRCRRSSSLSASLTGSIVRSYILQVSRFVTVSESEAPRLSITTNSTFPNQRNSCIHSPVKSALLLSNNKITRLMLSDRHCLWLLSDRSRWLFQLYHEDLSERSPLDPSAALSHPYPSVVFVHGSCRFSSTLHSVAHNAHRREFIGICRFETAAHVSDDQWSSEQTV